ncbi:TPA_asm: maturation protein [ssRNA phage Esthiorhiza.4_14]|uniref:Maturation protein n=3 Tax=Leviviricetes TaxID=2842243 RepID=A0A8S5L372_9VIRU|nr:maturation protein [ssRNA phage Esthiorhiza.4_14]QDH90324.1 MAG: hypothetical protein H4RhizoLitter21512_000004 [Leviviridae sp.]DAD51831.1 TPA_asm: maturation protein [ssRNA phage Esthiorhiza.4_14]
MPGRVRNASTVEFKNYGGRFGSTIGGGNVWSSYHTCSDVIGSGDNAPLNVFHETVEGGRLTKPNVGFFSSWFSNYRVDMLDTNHCFDHLGIVGDIFDADAATQAAAQTNPSRPYVDVVTNALQLGELFHLIQDAGTSFFRNIGNNNLMYQFGIAPVVGDLVKLMRFTDQVNRRVGEIQRLRSQHGLRRTVSIGNYASTAVVNKFIQTQNFTLRENFDVNTSLVIKAHCRWMPAGDCLSLARPPEMRALAQRAVLGATFDASSMWELIPWTWLIDWGTNIGQYFTAHRNIIPATLSDVSVMRHTRTEASWPGKAQDDWSCSGIRYVRENKTRATSFVAPVAHFPFLNGTQMGVAASLAVTRL